MPVEGKSPFLYRMYFSDQNPIVRNSSARFLLYSRLAVNGQPDG